MAMDLLSNLSATSQASVINGTLPQDCPCFRDVTDIEDSCVCPDDVTSDPLGTEAPIFYPWNNPENLISLETLLTVEKAVTCGLNPILLAVGFPGNVLSLVVFKRQGLGDRITVSLFSLALVDLMVVVLWFLLGSFCLLGHALPSLPGVMDWWKWVVRKYVRGFHRGFYYSSGCLTMIIAVERCLCVAMPLKAPKLLHTHTMTTIIVFAVVSLQLICLIYPFKFDVVTTTDEASGRSIISLPQTSHYLNYKAFIDGLENIVIMTVIPFVTFVVVTIATVVTVIKLKRVIAWREGAASNVVKHSEVGLVKMLVIVSCIYIVTASPNIVLGTIRFFNSDFWLTGKYRNIFVLTHLLYYALGCINSTVNFFVYVTRSSRFRAELYLMLPSCIRPKGVKRVGSRFLSSREPASGSTKVASISGKMEETKPGQEVVGLKEKEKEKEIEATGGATD